MKLYQFGGRARAIGAATLTLAVAAACSGSSKKPTVGGHDPIDAVVVEMHKAASGHTTGTTTGRKGATVAPLNGVFNGGVAGQGDVHAVFASASGTKLPTELRWVNNTLYFTRSTVSVAPTDQLAIFTRPATSKSWRSGSLTTTGFGAVIRLVPAAFSPVALADLLQFQHAQLTVHPGESVGSTKATRLSTTDPVPVGLWLGATVNLWVDGSNRILRVQITSPAGGTQYDVSNYGANVKIAPPPPADIQTKTEVPVKAPSGPFVTVKSGTTNGVTWALQRSPGTDGTECWRWQATPPLPQSGVAKPGDPECIPPTPTTSDDPTDLVTFVVVGKGTGSYDALAMLLPPGVKKLTLGHVGGKTEPLAPDREVVWVGPPEPTKGYLGVTLADGTTLDCGAGAVSSIGDLTDPRLTANLEGAAWGCVPPS